MTMPVLAAARDLVRKLDQLDDTQRACGVLPLAEQDMTWGERTRELRARVNLLDADGVTQDLLDALGAHVLAAKIALATAEETRVDSGVEAA